MSQNVVGAPVLCLASDGQVNIEIDCNDIPIQKSNENQDDCFNCIDIPFWNNNSDFPFIVKSADFDFNVHEINYKFFSHVNYTDVSLIFQSIENPQTHFISFLKYTVLLI
ncbi:MAG: hypothetical protein GWP19_13775 [Planctomycetia bacterium]|nr:hypothetical protein [Planctomycetia bacterium]